MDVILLERIERLGQMGDVVKVKPGFARNYLLPQKKALRATKENREYFEKQRAQLEAQNLTRRQDAEKVSSKLDGISVIIIRQAGEFGQLYGSVTTRDIATAITAAGFTVDRRQIMLDVPIKTLGLHKTRVALHPEVTVSVTLNVAPSEEEAAMQAAGKAAGAPATAEAEAAAEAAAAAPAAEPEPAAAEAEAPAEPKKKKAKAKKAKAEDAE
ncbi:MAG TPA: 50S ribosomal protein L9 [Alphaproteobacteria bacterium]|nr:50S ribosomal protein L9 [Alphaproteobacteria bacterium]